MFFDATMKYYSQFIILLLLFCTTQSIAKNYYINAVTGDDKHSGNNALQPWQSVKPLQLVTLQPGDSILLANGQTHIGMLMLKQVYGTAAKPIIISGYRYAANKQKPVIDAGKDLHALHIQNASFLHIKGIELTAPRPYQQPVATNKTEMRCGILIEVTEEKSFENIMLSEVVVHDVYYNEPGFTRTAAEVKSANGTQSYGWGIRMINNTKSGILSKVKVLHAEVYNVSHTGLKATAGKHGIRNLEISNCRVYNTGGPGMQFSGVTNAHIHHNNIHHSGSVADSRNWGRGSGLWTWGCSNILIEHNRFENANGPGDSAGVHIDYNCNDVVVQYNFSANNAGGFCEILGNNYNCAYRYNISVNDGHRIKGNNGAFQEGKIFWLSGYQGNEKPNAGPYNSYFYNNSIYVGASIVPKIAVSSSASGILIANNIFYFENAAQMVAGDQKKKEVDLDGVPNVFFKNNLFLRADSWPAAMLLKDEAPLLGDPLFLKKGGVALSDYSPTASFIRNKGVEILPLPTDSIGLRIGLHVKHDILGNAVIGKPDLGAIEYKKP